MKKIILTATTLMLTSGMAFAAGGSDHYGSDYNHGSSNGSMVFKPLATPNYAYPMLITGATAGTQSLQGTSASDIQAPGYGQGIWGSR
jgi:hypothetical protein